MKRFIWNFTTFISALLLLGVAGGWIYSQWRCCYARWFVHDGVLLVGTTTESIVLGQVRYDWSTFSGHWTWDIGPASSIDRWGGQNATRFNLLGFVRISDVAIEGHATIEYLASPFWFVATIFLIPPFLWLRNFRRSRRRESRRAAGLCLNCGYDLRSSSDRCPECGKELVGTTNAHR